ncbi:MAG TPA: helix-turn-helix transcriptional regulator [Chloroflexota bacterium]|nr:helix-turn-helix transcriptional regulator [Chloroflexota bacterium]HZU38603.1 helix-turn-helix transcriptional regulator [Gemmataceae bacterium]
MGRDSPLSFGTLLRRARRAAGLTQEELAERSSVSVRTGTPSPSWPMLRGWPAMSAIASR